MFKDSLKKTELLERIHWLILLRWIAVFGLFVTTYIASSIFNVVEWVIPLYSIAIIIGLANMVFYWHTGALSTETFASVQKHAGIQIMADHFFLVCLIYFAGGIENPFIFYFLFHAFSISRLHIVTLSSGSIKITPSAILSNVDFISNITSSLFFLNLSIIDVTKYTEIKIVLARAKKTHSM